MPYIDPHTREVLNRPLDKLIRYMDAIHCKQAGMVNYSIAYLISELIKRRGCSYAVLNEFIGALECCKLEIYRRLAVPHEELKCAENGDVFPTPDAEA